MNVTPQRGEPLTVPCPDCQAVPGDACTTPTSTKRRAVTWFHVARRDAADSVTEMTPSEYLAQRVLRLADPATDPETEFVCDCGRSVPATASVEDLAALFDHAVHDHPSRRDVFIKRTSVFATGYELALLLGLDAFTGAEQTWRDRQATT